jgi:hypothetical protein
MRTAAIVLANLLTCAVLSAAGSWSAMSASADFTAILDVCEATSLDEATNRGGRLGWPAAPEDRDWHAGFERHNGGPVHVVGWRRTEREGDGLLSYWVASGAIPTGRAASPRTSPAYWMPCVTASAPRTPSRSTATSSVPSEDAARPKFP